MPLLADLSRNPRPSDIFTILRRRPTDHVRPFACRIVSNCHTEIVLYSFHEVFRRVAEMDDFFTLLTVTLMHVVGRF